MVGRERLRNLEAQEYRYCRVDLMGCMGIGKTSLCELIKQDLGFEILYENVDNPYLPDFYGNPERWAFHSQVYFAGDKARKLKNASLYTLPDKPLAVDQSPFMDYVFAWNAYRSDLMEERDWETYQMVFNGLMAGIPSPDLIVVLLAGPEVSQARNISRDREVDKDVPLEYFQSLTQTLEEWLKINREDFNVLEIYTDNLDLVKSEKDIASTLDRIQNGVSRVKKERGLMPFST